MKENNNIFDSNGCLTHDILIKYIKGELSNLERNKIEKHLASCEICSDELEGLSLLENPERLESIVDEINSKIDKYPTVKQPKVVKLNFLLRVAAGIALLIGISSIVYIIAFKYRTSTLMTESKEQNFNLPNVSTDTFAIGEVGPIRGVLKSPEKTFSKQKSTSEPQKMAEIKVEEDKVANYEFVDSPSISEVVTAMANEPMIISQDTILEVSNLAQAEVAMDEVIVVSDQVADKALAGRAGGVQVAAYGLKTSKKESTLDKAIVMQKAILLFDNGKYKKAQSAFNEILKNYPENDSLRFYLGVCYFKLGDYLPASFKLSDFQFKPSSNFYSKGKWYYTLSLKKLGRYSEADSLLKSIIDENSPFREKAEQELENQ